MEDIVEPIVDIDGSDRKNPLAVVDYIEDLYAYYRKMEVCSLSPCLSRICLKKKKIWFSCYHHVSQSLCI